MADSADQPLEPIGRLLVRAVQLHGRGDLDGALILFRQLLAREPDHRDALSYGGIAAFQSGDRETGLSLLRRAVEVAPKSAVVHNNLGNLLLETGALDEARAAFETAIALDPGFAQAHKNLGNAFHFAGDPAAAAAVYRHALELTPDDPQLHDYLGAALSALGELTSAVASYRRAIQLDPTYAVAFNNLAATLQKMDQLDEALDACRRAVALQPDYAKAQFNLGCLLQSRRRPEEAIAAYRRALELDPTNAEAHYNLGLVFQAAGHLEQARGAYQAALAADPTRASARHMLAALSGQTTEIAPQDHIRQMFDNYAQGFEAHLVEVLGYSAPEALERIVADHHRGRDPAPGFSRMLDLGCGTGLVARRFRDRTETIEGIDLAPRMVALARDSGLYEEVHQATLEEFFGACRAEAPAYDLVTSADVFIYIGRLDAVFSDVARNLVPGGLFVFSVERLEAGQYQLLPSGRYAQSESYIRELAGDIGFRAELFSRFVVRKEYNTEVDGLACLLVRDH